MTPVTLDRKNLGKLGTVLGEGGQARIYEAPRLTLPDLPGPLVYKEYKAPTVSASALRLVVGKHHLLDDAQRARLDGCTAWPLRVVEDGGRALGVVMRRLPQAFLQVRVLPGTGRRKEGPREVQNLFIAPDLARRLGMPAPTPRQRLQICRDLAAAVHAVHKLDLVVGDVNARNAVFRLTEKPHVMLIDCDAVRKMGSGSAVPQLNAPDWDPPEGKDALSQQTDRYKFGLFVLRCLCPRSMGSLARDPADADAQLDAAGRKLLRTALLGHPRDRPALQDWGRYLQAVLDGRPPPPPRKPAPPVVPGPRPQPRTGGLRRDASGVWRRVP